MVADVASGTSEASGVSGASGAWRTAVALGGGRGVVEGPLHGHHHETYVVPLALDGRGEPNRWKCREPRPGLFWFDRRCFASEEEVVRALAGRVSRVPRVIETGGVTLQRFIEGTTLGASYPFGKAVPGRLVEQIMRVFAELVVIDPAALSARRTCSPQDMPADGETGRFLERLIRFTEDRVYRRHHDEFGGLFAALGVDDVAFKRLRSHVEGLHRRPFGLLHADLHRENLIVDGRGRLWFIDWELAMFGDPLYDLATHVHLMRYPVWQRHRVGEMWARTVEGVRPGAARGWRDDLPLLLDFKRAHSVFTDVIRSALALPTGPAVPAHVLDASLAGSGVKLHRLLRRAAPPLGLTYVPSPEAAAHALKRWLSGR
ncbi:phosphotransferase [Streptomyces beihaiensis]|uniref:Phosphotransferase n=1 Tax=Streptomyces beihaiensis TaxID=2984495 RepID=A0ABT3TQ12_9ACTN|nr:phosphotransferase [Streptomyces beihaiensis]MCX3059096.1 phosphotransferase [Streptomyces beihaiensis]